MRRIALYAVLLLLPIFHSACTQEDNPLQNQNPGGSGDGNKEDTVDWHAVADESSDALLQYYWNTGKNFFNYYPLKADTSSEAGYYWPQAHAMDVIIDAYVRSGNSKWESYFSMWHVGVRQKSDDRNYGDNYVDDMEWICLTMLRLYECTGDRKYMDTAELLWGKITANWNDLGGGGIAWTLDKQWSKNARSNGPAGIIAARMYELNGEKEEDYQWLERIYEWQTKYLVNAQTGAVYDSLDARDGKVNSGWIFSYNQGTYLGMAHELYRLSGGTRKDCLSMAVKAANYTMGYLTVNGIMKPLGMGDGGLFNGIFIRYFTKLILEGDIHVSTRQHFRDFLYRNAKSLYINGTNPENNLYSSDWTVPGSLNGGNNDLGVQVSGCTLIEARALLEKTN